MEISPSICIHIGEDLYLNKEYAFLDTPIASKTPEEYKQLYKNRLERQLIYLEKEIRQIVTDIDILKKKNEKFLEQFSKKCKGNVLNLLYKNNTIVNYFTAINTLESKQFKFNKLTIQSLEEQYSRLVDIFQRVEHNLNNITVSVAP
jgi:uncharacterized protein (UPF0128 family)